MKLKKIIRYIWHRLYFLFKTPFLKDISPRGIYYCHYCISRYINREEEKPQEQYDAILTEKKNKLESIHFFDKMHLQDEVSKYILTSFIHVGAILCYINKRGRNQIFGYIKNPDDLKFLKGIINKKIII